MRAWINGHNHAGDYAEFEGIHCLTMHGMVETADTTAYAEVEIWSNRLEILGEGREPDRSLYFPEANTLAAPVALSAGDGTTGISLSWDAYAGTDATSFELQRRISGENTSYESIATLGVSDTSYLDENVSSSSTYVYRLRAVTDGGDVSDWVLTSYKLSNIPGQVTDLTATAGENNAIALTWTLDSTGYDSLILERSIAGTGEYELVTAELSGDATSYTDTGLLPNTEYSYRIAGVAAGRQTDWSDAGTASSGSLPVLEGEAEGLVAYWSFDEGTGTSAVDATSNGSNGTLQGDAEWTAGVSGSAIQMKPDSATQVYVGAPSLLNITGAVTVMAWVHPDGVSNYGVIAGIDQSGGATNDQYVLKTTVSSTSMLTFQVSSGGSGYTATDTVSLSTRASQTANGWVHVAGVVTPGESVKLYVNGELITTTPVSFETLQSTLDGSSVPFRIGNMSSSSDYGFNGAIDELRVFAASVSAEDIATYAEGEAVVEFQGTLIAQGSTWSYLDDGSDQGTVWTAVDFDDSSWSSGAAQLGYGDGDETTTVSYGSNSSNKYPTTYFRQSFEIDEVNLPLISQLNLNILRDDGAVVYINGVEVARDNMNYDSFDYQTYASGVVDGANEDTFFAHIVDPSVLQVGTNVIAVEIHQQRSSSSDISFDLFLEAKSSADAEAIAAGSTWSYLDDGSDQGTAWTAIDFDDATWSTGVAQLGYGGNGEATTISYGNDGNDKHITYYFRQSFEVETASDVAGLLFKVLRDDGVIVYLNGHEVVRDNMPAGAINSETHSSEIISGDDENTFYEFHVPAYYLVDGTNVVAAEIHNRDGTSSDLSFDLSLILVGELDENAATFTEDSLTADDANAKAGYSFSLASYVSNADDDALTYSILEGPDWLSIDENGSLTGTPGPDDIGPVTVIVSVSDDDGASVIEITLTVGTVAELARAPLPSIDDEALSFGVIPDTQGGTNGTPPDEAAAIAARFIGHAPSFIIHCGDVTDGNSSNGNTKFSQLEDLKELLVNPLAEHGIGFYPVRGNHDSNAYNQVSSGVSAWAAAFPYLFEGDDPIVDPTDVPGGSVDSPNDSNFCYVYSPNDNVFMVSVDQWNGGASSNYSDWVAAKFKEIRESHPDAHIFGFSHSGLYALASHPAMSEFVSGGSEPYIAAGKQYQIDGWFSGHNHIYDRSMAVDLENGSKPYMFDFTCGSASEKFYSLSRTPADDQHVNAIVDSTATEGRPIAYLMVDVTGPFVQTVTYMSPDTSGSGTFDDWSVWDAYTYSRNGLQFTVAAGQNYNERDIADSAPDEDGFVGTRATITDGVNSDTTSYTVGATTFSVYRNITTGWLTREQWYDAGDANVVSDIVSIHGMTNDIDTNRSDTYTLTLSYDGDSLSDEQVASLYIAVFLDEDTSDDDEGGWYAAADQTAAGELAAEPLMRAATEDDELGAWGIDTDTQTVWVRLDYQGDFAVASTLTDSDGDGLVDAWEMDHFGSLAYDGTSDVDGDGLTNLQEQAVGSSPLDSDSDNDLIDDATEVQNGLDPTTANSSIANSIASAIANSSVVQSAYGLYTADSLASLVGQSLIEVKSDKTISVELQLWESSDLEHWTPLGDSEAKTLSDGGSGAAFYIWQLGSSQE
ncbi:MAG: LamG-like jellyroll fold domain-containing protein [Puniceicoccales bacterium]